jgi:protein phosphatase PTC7
LAYLQRAYEQTLEATKPPNDWLGTTTAASALLHFKQAGKAKYQGQNHDRQGQNGEENVTPLLYVTNLGDSQVMVIRPRTRSLIFKSVPQWHWFDCPRQLGTNSPDSPLQNAVVDEVGIEEGDIVLAMTDGVVDNLWEHEIVENVSESVRRWENGEGRDAGRRGHQSTSQGSGEDGGITFVAEELVSAAKVIAQDPFAESPFMEHAIEEGLASEGGKLDDISVVAALCRRNSD